MTDRCATALSRRGSLDRAIIREGYPLHTAIDMPGQRDSVMVTRVHVYDHAGHVGARNVKWLAKIVASAHESDSHWQQRDYKSEFPIGLHRSMSKYFT